MCSDAMTRDDDGFTYVVTDEMLRRFATSTVAQRLEWLDEMRTFRGPWPHRRRVHDGDVLVNSGTSSRTNDR